MRRIALALCVVALGACNQPKGTSSAPSQAAAPPKPTPPVEWKPVTYTDGSAKLSYLGGNDPHRFFGEFKSRTEAVAKDEFETTEQFKARTANPNTFLKPFTVDDKYVFLLTGTMNYEADHGAFESYSGEWCSDGYPFKGYVSCKIGSATLTSENYVGQNAFGATANVERETGNDYYLLFPLKSPSARAMRRNSYSYSLPVNCQVPIEKAKAVKDVKVLLVGKVKKAEIVEGESRLDDATVSNPHGAFFQSYGIPFEMTNLVCFARATGEVLHVQSFTERGRK